MIAIPVDFNNVRSDGRLNASSRRLTSPVAAGDDVVVFDEDESLAHPAVVDDIDQAGRLVLVVDWATPAELPTNPRRASVL